ncbi:hypothetical protein V8G54_031848 [Vigna mungo]|uniref:Uncharacterized protein n=1 Tax=Vigna mungo TaxID=3915 RepID=A0AAQ3MKW0_VIGMU
MPLILIVGINHTVPSYNVFLGHFVEQFSCYLQPTTFGIHVKNCSCKNDITIRCGHKGIITSLTNALVDPTSTVNVSAKSTGNQSIHHSYFIRLDTPMAHVFKHLQSFTWLIIVHKPSNQTSPSNHIRLGNIIKHLQS